MCLLFKFPLTLLPYPAKTLLCLYIIYIKLKQTPKLNFLEIWFEFLKSIQHFGFSCRLKNKGGSQNQFQGFDFNNKMVSRKQMVTSYFQEITTHFKKLCHILSLGRKVPVFYIFETNFPAVTLSVLNSFLTSEDFSNIDNFLVPYDRIACQN